MTATPIAVYAPAQTSVVEAGVAVIAVYGPVLGGLIQNPATAADQGIAVAEPLYVDIVGTASLVETTTTVPLRPGDIFIIPAGLVGNISVNAASAGHEFSGLVYQSPPQFPPAPQTGTFPPAGPTTLTQILLAYLYQEYNDDDALLSFFASYNSIAQGYLSWFANVALAVYTSPLITGALLDWVAEGLYGMTRPSLGSGRNRDIGPLNTYAYNTLALNRRRTVGPSNVVATSDDVFKRVMTWNFYKGDGNAFNIRWLKRRIKRFLIGENGTAPNIDETYDISVTVGDGIISIQIAAGTRVITGGALYNRFGFNRMTYNGLQTRFVPSPTIQYPLAPVLEEAIEAGVLQFPVQYEVTISI